MRLVPCAGKQNTTAETLLIEEFFLFFLSGNFSYLLKQGNHLSIKTALKAQSVVTALEFVSIFSRNFSYLNSVSRLFIANVFKFEHSRRFRVDMFGSVAKFEAVYTRSWRTHALVDQLFLLQNNVTAVTWVVAKRAGKPISSQVIMHLSSSTQSVCGAVYQQQQIYLVIFTNCYQAVTTSKPSQC